MSQEKLRAFAEAVSKSEELQKRLTAIQVETARSIAKLSESAGTPFTAEEYLNSIADSSEEMSADQLSSVAGGSGSIDIPKSIDPSNCTDIVNSVMDPVKGFVRC